MSFYIAFGRYAGLYALKGPTGIRVCLGWVSLCWCPYDLDVELAEHFAHSMARLKNNSN